VIRSALSTQQQQYLVTLLTPCQVRSQSDDAFLVKKVVTWTISKADSCDRGKVPRTVQQTEDRQLVHGWALC
jgi:hypothetical protein